MKHLSAGVVLVLQAVIAWGQGLEYPVDVAIDDKGVIFVADHQAHALLVLEGSSFKPVTKGEGLPRTPLFGIRHIAPEKGGAWVASDPATMQLYRIDSEGVVTSVPDDGQFVAPWGVAVQPTGLILVVDRLTNRLRRLEAGGKVTDVAEVRAPRAILFDEQGNTLILTDRNLVKVVDGGKTEPLLDTPSFELAHDAVLHPNGNYYVTDGYKRAIWQVTPQGQVSVLVEGAPLMSPQGMTVDKEGNLVVADPHAKALFKVSIKGEVSVVAR